MTEIPKWKKPTQTVPAYTRAPPPITPTGASTVATMPRKTTKTPNWDFWRHKTQVALWEAAFLSCDVDPDSAQYEGIRDNSKVEKRLRLLRDNVSLKEFFSVVTPTNRYTDYLGVRLSEFAAWCAYVAFDIPPALAALANAAPDGNRPAANVDGPVAVGKLINKLRRDTLDPAIDKAIAQAGSHEVAAVWPHLKDIATKKTLPFTGPTNGTGLYYTDVNDKRALFTKNALTLRLKRRKEQK